MISARDIAREKLFVRLFSTLCRHGAEQYEGDLECVFYGYHLDRAILKIAEATYCLMPSLMRNNDGLVLTTSRWL